MYQSNAVGNISLRCHKRGLLSCEDTKFVYATGSGEEIDWLSVQLLGGSWHKQGGIATFEEAHSLYNTRAHATAFRTAQKQQAAQYCAHLFDQLWSCQPVQVDRFSKCTENRSYSLLVASWSFSSNQNFIVVETDDFPLHWPELRYNGPSVWIKAFCFCREY